MQKETEQFYLEHKDKTWELPKFPDGMDETNGDEVTNWILEEMKAGNIGWIELNLMNVKGGDFIPIAWHHMGQIETQSLTLKNFYTKDPENNERCLLHNENDWIKENNLNEEIGNIHAYWQNDFCGSNFKNIEFIKIPSRGSMGIHCDNINDDKDKILLPVKDIFPLTTSMKEPSKNCHIIVEGFGRVPIKEGRTYLINPYRKKVVVNTSDTEEAIHTQVQVIPGTKFGEFVNCLTRSYFEFEGRMGKDYLRQFKHLAERGGRPGVMDY